MHPPCLGSPVTLNWPGMSTSQLMQRRPRKPALSILLIPPELRPLLTRDLRLTGLQSSGGSVQVMGELKRDNNHLLSPC